MLSITICLLHSFLRQKWCNSVLISWTFYTQLSSCGIFCLLSGIEGVFCLLRSDCSCIRAAKSMWSLGSWNVKLVEVFWASIRVTVNSHVHVDYFIQSYCYSASYNMWALAHCRISPPRFLAECRKRWLNQGQGSFKFFFCCVSRCIWQIYLTQLINSFTCSNTV